jgi:UDP-2,3-diacylglucosamine hydrolase
VSFVGGNHDAWGGRFLRDEVGMELVDGPKVMELAGRRALVAHGDGVGRGDLKYRALRRLIRHPWTIGAFRLLHPDWGSRLADLASSTDVKLAEHDPGAKNRAAFIEAWARERIAADPSLDLVLAGHCHQPRLEEVEPGRFYANTGDWIRHFTYLKIPPVGAPELLRWPVKG